MIISLDRHLQYWLPARSREEMLLWIGMTLAQENPPCFAVDMADLKFHTTERGLGVIAQRFPEIIANPAH